jgi:hypothetical protein
VAALNDPFTESALTDLDEVAAVTIPPDGEGRILVVATVQASNETSDAAELTCRLRLDDDDLGFAYAQVVPANGRATVSVSASDTATDGQDVVLACSESGTEVELTNVRGELNVWSGGS